MGLQLNLAYISLLENYTFPKLNGKMGDKNVKLSLM